MRIVLQGVFRRTAETLGASLRHHQPCFGRNELAEANPLVHLGMALAESGFFVYAQCPLHGKRYPRVDLVALTRRNGFVVEAKRLHAGQGAGWMVGDWDRLGRVPLRVRAPPHRKPTLVYRAIMATTQSKAIGEWWASRGRPRTPGRSRGRSELGWLDLGRALRSAGDVDALPLEDDSHMLLYAFGPRERPLFAG